MARKKKDAGPGYDPNSPDKIMKTEHAWHGLDFSDLEGTLDSVIEFLQIKAEEIGGDAKIDMDYGYEGPENIGIVVNRERLETDEEFRERQAAIAARKAAEEARAKREAKVLELSAKRKEREERKLLQRLKAKYEPQLLQETI